MATIYDVVVAGGGTAGCVLAARLSEDGERNVCLVEAGPDYGPYAAGRWPADILDGHRLALESHCWAAERDDRSQLRARILGGCSAHNACVMIEGAPGDYDEWGPGWSYRDLEPCLRRAEAAFGCRRLSPDRLSPWHRAFTAAGGDDAIIHLVNMRESVRWNAAFAYLDPARARPNLTILSDALVDRVIIRAGRAAGVATAQGDVHARTVVLTAGAYGTPGILLRTGLGPPVGEGLSDHVGVGMAWEPTEELRRETAPYEAKWGTQMAQVTIYARSSSCPADLWDLFLFPALDPGCEISAAVFAMKPHSRGRVGLTSDAPEAPLAVEHGFLSDPHDADVVVEGLEQLRERVGSAALRRFASRELRPGQAADLPDYVRRSARGFFHPVGTCAIGAVVDSSLRVLELESLYIGDASVMPTIPRANTNLTVAAVAERLAGLLRAEV